MHTPVKIALCEDAQADMDHLAALIGRCMGGGRPLHIDQFVSGESLMRTFAPDRYDAVFLDIYLGGDMTGLDAAKAIRAQDARCAIVFATVSSEFALDSYQVRAAHYLIKPVDEADLSEVWRRIDAEARRDADHNITLIVNRKPVRVPCSEILYAEARAKMCLVHTEKSVLDTRLTIDQIEHMLPSPPFMRCHRGYIVNFDQVKDISVDFIMKSGDTVYIRQTERGRIRDAYFRHLIEKAKRGGSEAGDDVL